MVRSCSRSWTKLWDPQLSPLHVVARRDWLGLVLVFCREVVSLSVRQNSMTTIRKCRLPSPVESSWDVSPVIGPTSCWDVGSRSRVDANVQSAGAWMQWFNEPTATVNLTNGDKRSDNPSGFLVNAWTRTAAIPVAKRAAGRQNQLFSLLRVSLSYGQGQVERRQKDSEACSD
jgi:hypothetical protein